jgi:hypothetical protein
MNVKTTLLASCCICLLLSVPTKAQTVETVTNYVMPDGTIFDVPNNYSYDWYKQGVTYPTEVFRLFLKLPELQPQNVKTWKGLHWGIGADPDALRILVHWKQDIREHFSILEKISLDEMQSLSDYATVIPDTDHDLHYSFHWSKPRNSAVVRDIGVQEFDEVYFKRDETGLVRSISCSPAVNGARRKGTCRMILRHKNFEVRSHFPRSHFANWKKFEAAIIDMLVRFKRKT